MKIWNIAIALFVSLQALPCITQDRATPGPAQPGAAAPSRDPNSTETDLAVPLCPASFDDGLELNGIAGRTDKSVAQPTVKHMPEPEYPPGWLDYVPKKRKRSMMTYEAVLSFVVDADGNPQTPCLMKSAGYGLDAAAAKLIQQYQFAPATKDGKPVPKRISMSITSTKY